MGTNAHVFFYLSVFVFSVLVSKVEGQKSCTFHLLDGDRYTVQMSLESDQSDNVDLFLSVVREYRSDIWLGLGISPGNNMAGSDIFIIEVTENYKIKQSDYYALENGMPIRDTVFDNNWKLKIFYISDNWVNFTATKPVKVTDTQDIGIKDEDQGLIWALGDFNEDGQIKYDGSKRGHRTFNLWQETCGSSSRATSHIFTHLVLVMTLKLFLL